MDKDTIERLEQLIGYRFSDHSFLRKALTHSSHAENRLVSNERLEFLGDSVLALVICRALFERFPDYLEGDLTRIKSRIVSRKTCAQISNKLGLPEFVRVGKGMSRSRAMSGSISAGTLESIVAAVYLDGGFEPARKLILKFFGKIIENSNAHEHQDNYKSVLQQYSQNEFNFTPVYDLLDEKGPDHNKCFEVNVVIARRRFKSAWGVTKKEAEQKAAYNALVELGLIEDDEE
jgi:ribonuclease-3